MALTDIRSEDGALISRAASFCRPVLLYFDLAMNTSEYWIRKLALERHPEGGFYRETYRSPLTVGSELLPSTFQGERAASTAIYFLLRDDDFSALHRLRSDEMWHFYAGSTLIVHLIDAQGDAREIRLGPDLDAGESLQGVVPAGCWFGACLKNENSFALVGCTVAPGFDFADFELGKRAELVASYPQHRRLIEHLTRN